MAQLGANALGRIKFGIIWGKGALTMSHDVMAGIATG